MPPRGWYDDPADPARERYWDGARWSQRVRRRLSLVRRGSDRPSPSPKAARPTPPTGRPAGPGPDFSPADGPTRPAGPDSRRPLSPGPSSTADGPASAPGLGPTAGGPRLLAPAPPPAGAPYPNAPAVLTPPADGALLLASWGRRMAAAAIDYLIEGGLLLIVLWLAGDFGRRLVDGYREWLEVWMAGLADQSYQMPAVPVQLAADVQRLGFAQVGVYLVYSLVFLTTWGATIGMRLLGLKVVPAPPLGDRPTPPGAVLAPDDKLPWGRAVVRSVVWAGFFLPLFVLAQLLNCLRPLWHPRRQTFHDSLARTVVIRRR